MAGDDVSEQQQGTIDPHRALMLQIVNHRIMLPNQFVLPVYVEEASVDHGLIYLRLRTHDGQLVEIPVTEEELNQAAKALNKEDDREALLTLVPPRDFFLLIESTRIRLTFAFDPYFGGSALT